MGKIRQAGMVVLIGLGVILMGYPWFSNWLYQHHVASSANVYEQYAAESGTSEITKQLETARRYNQDRIVTYHCQKIFFMGMCWIQQRMG